ncbi:MAG: hypothetical protein IPP94_17780 [Ignavibacteria bacterium]|nr:hypothetical protein [Ignavibacteria bacterium]
MTRFPTCPLLTALLCCLSLTCLLPGCKLLKDNENRGESAGQPPRLLSEALASRFKGAHIDRYAEINTASGWRTYVAAFNSGGIRRTARVVPGRGLVAWQKFLRAEEIPAAVRDSVHAREGALNIRSAGEIRLRDEAGAERLAAYRILCRRSDIASNIWILNPDGTILPEGLTRLEVDSLLGTDLE